MAVKSTFMGRASRTSRRIRVSATLPGWSHAYFKAPKTMEDLIAGRNAIAEWARITYGWLGRAPDYKASFLATLGANADFYDPFQANARRWYKYSQESVA